MNCLRCGRAMEDLGCEEIQLGHYGFFSGHLSNLFSGALDVRIYACPGCGKLEFFKAGHEQAESFTEQEKTNTWEEE